MLVTKFHLLLLFFMICICACDKNEIEPAPPSKTKTDLLTQLPWRKYADIICTDIIKECEKDDRYSFRKDGKLVRTFGIWTCYSSETDEYDNQWSFSPDEKTLTIAYTIWGESTWTVDSLTEDILIISTPLPGCMETTTFLH